MDNNTSLNLSIDELVHIIEIKLRNSKKEKLLQKKYCKYFKDNKIKSPWNIISEYHKLICLIIITSTLLICIILVYLNTNIK